MCTTGKTPVQVRPNFLRFPISDSGFCTYCEDDELRTRSAATTHDAQLVRLSILLQSTRVIIEIDRPRHPPPSPPFPTLSTHPRPTSGFAGALDSRVLLANPISPLFLEQGGEIFLIDPDPRSLCLGCISGWKPRTGGHREDACLTRESSSIQKVYVKNDIEQSQSTWIHRIKNDQSRSPGISPRRVHRDSAKIDPS
jgi:hypothetical protein